MKKNIFFNGLSAKIALAVMALTSTLFTSCEKEDFNATFEADAAKAVITVSAYDAENGAELNPTKITTSAGSVEGNKITITGDKDIAKQTVTVTIEYNDLTGSGKVEIPALKAGSVGNYSITFVVGEKEIYVPVDPEYEAAKAVITAKTQFEEGAEEVDVTYSFESTVEGGTAEGNVFTIVGAKNIPAQTVTVTAHVGEKDLVEVVDIPALKEGTVNNYTVIFHVVPDGKDVVTITTYVVSSEAPKSEESPRYYLTGNYNHSHNGIDQWIANDAEWLLEAKVNYNSYVGYEYVNEVIEKDCDFVKVLTEPLKNAAGIKEYPETMKFKVSAWSLYAAWAVVTTTTTNYTVNEIVSTTIDGEEQPDQVSKVASYSIVNKSVVADHTEIAHPDHSHAYVPGHGHDHGHGNGNAGGGIVIPD